MTEVPGERHDPFPPVDLLECANTPSKADPPRDPDDDDEADDEEDGDRNEDLDPAVIREPDE
jgi:hypothetical protein